MPVPARHRQDCKPLTAEIAKLPDSSLQAQVFLHIQRLKSTNDMQNLLKASLEPYKMHSCIQHTWYTFIYIYIHHTCLHACMHTCRCVSWVSLWIFVLDFLAGTIVVLIDKALDQETNRKKNKRNIFRHQRNFRHIDCGNLSIYIYRHHRLTFRPNSK